MFALFAFTVLMCLSLILLIVSRSFISRAVKNTVSIIAVILILFSAVTLIVDFTAYTKGGIISEEHITIRQVKINDRIEFFSVNNKYWSVGENFKGHIMATALNPTNMEIRTTPIETILQYPIAIYHLPISKCIIKMEYLTTDRHLENKNFEFYKSGYIDTENKLISIVALLSFIALIAVIITTIKKKRCRIEAVYRCGSIE